MSRIIIEPNEKQGVYQWQSLGYEVPKELLTDISMTWTEDIGIMTPLMWNHIKWIIQRTLFYNSSEESKNE